MTTKTELLNNGVVVATRTAAPFYSWDWTPSTSGASSLTYKRYEDGVLVYTSGAITGDVVTSGSGGTALLDDDFTGATLNTSNFSKVGGVTTSIASSILTVSGSGLALGDGRVDTVADITSSQVIQFKGCELLNTIVSNNGFGLWIDINTHAVMQSKNVDNWRFRVKSAGTVILDFDSTNPITGSNIKFVRTGTNLKVKIWDGSAWQLVTNGTQVADVTFVDTAIKGSMYVTSDSLKVDRVIVSDSDYSTVTP